jgi:fructose-1,6-bisphosphatase/inositol monophosphatase family enzyme
MRKYDKEFSFAKKIVVEVYENILNKPISNIKTKRDNSLVTDLDEACEDYVIDAIKKEFINDNFISEERNPDNKVMSRTWVLDPIDGTKCFIKGFVNWGIQLAFIDDNDTWFGIIYLPRLNELYYCYKGEGVYLNDKKIEHLENNSAKDSVVEYCGGVQYKIENTGKINKELTGKVSMQCYFGSACGSYANLLSQRTDYLISTCKNVWDIAPGVLMCEEMGTKITETKGGFKLYSNSNEIDKTVKETIADIII